MIALAIQERGGIWHAVDGPSDPDATFRPILCGRYTGEGIVLPGNACRREVTCPGCLNHRSAASRDSDLTKEADRG